MNTRFRYISLFLLVGLVAAMFFSCNRFNPADKILITRVPTDAQNAKSSNNEAHFPEGAMITIVDPQKPASLKVLTGDFNSAFGPDVSWDGKTMVFTARKNQDDPWQIWEMDLRSQKSRKVTESTENCVDPVYLPLDRIVYSQQVNGKIEHFALFTCNIDGSEPKQVTFHPHSNFGTIVMQDGRLLTISSGIFPAKQDPMIMVMRPDGTKADYFYQGGSGKFFVGRAREKHDQIYFIEADSTGKAGDIISVMYNRPANCQNITSGIDGSFNAVIPLNDYRMLVSYRNNQNEPFGLFEFDGTTRELGKQILSMGDANIFDAVAIEVHERPKKLPSEVDMGVKTGLLLCQNINFTGMGISDFSDNQKAYKIEIVGIDSSLGIVDVEEDGSFYLKVHADQPFRIRTLDQSNKVMNQGSAWIWLRPNERRGCIGCHEDRELAPENVVPLAVKKSPVSVPVMISNIHEKEVELE